jgi:enhancer of polycomb-like protein
MDEDDDIALKQINARLPAGQAQISEDAFEEVMNFFEETAQAAQPFANLDGTPVLPLEELKKHFDDTHPEYVQTLSDVVYEHWSMRRNLNGNRGLAPHLKFETHAETDDSDPYVCFRRRELRQIRKTRNRDAQSAEKLRKLRIELESARTVLLMVKRREQMRRDQLELDRSVFEQRMAFRDTKRKLGIKGDDDLLINQKKPKLPQGVSPNQAALAQGLRLPPGSVVTGTELRKLEDVENDKQRGVLSEINQNIEKHTRWNEGWKDKTMWPLTPDSEPDLELDSGGYRQAIATTYPTPPTSQSEDEDTNAVAIVDKRASRASTPSGYFSPPEDGTSREYASYRRRIGRGGRVLVDRRLPSYRRGQAVEEYDPFKYDNSDESDVEETVDTNSERDFVSMFLKGQLAPAGRQYQQVESARRASEAAQNPAQLAASTQHQQIAGH